VHVTLEDVVKGFDTLNEDSTICARRPWTAKSEAVVVVQLPTGGIPLEVTDGGLEYFLEVSVAREVLHGYRRRTLSVEQKLYYLIYYAENDVYPDD
jgi:hypothetical protein